MEEGAGPRVGQGPSSVIIVCTSPPLWFRAEALLLVIQMQTAARN